MALNKELIEEMVNAGRSSSLADFDDPVLGPLRLLPGTWRNTEELQGFAFNMMALPFREAPNGFKVLMNQCNEELNFSVVDKGVPNRGNTQDPDTGNFDQTIVALNYFQKITQVDSDDFRKSDLHGRFDGKPIHKEPGLWLHMTDHETTGINIARLGSIPHGNSFLAAGRYSENPGPDFITNPTDQQVHRLIPNINGVVVWGGGTQKKSILNQL